MKKSRKVVIQSAVSACFAAAFLFLIVPAVKTYPPFLGKAKSLGFPANDCTYCHINAAGGEPYNARGKWLISEKEKRGASAVDVVWLKEYGKGGAAAPSKAKQKASAAPLKASEAPVTAKRAATATSAVAGSASSSAVGKREPVRALSGSMMGNEIATRLGNDRPGFKYILRSARLVDGKLQFDGSVQPAGAASSTSGGGGAAMTATLVGTLSRARNPWPDASESSAPQRRNRERAAASTAAATGPSQSAGQAQTQGRETRNPENTAQLGSLSQSTQPTARTTQTPTAPEGQRPSASEANEQTQSLYSSADVGLGCEILYLKVMLPARLATTAKTQNQPVQVGVVLAPQDNKRGEEINNQVCRVVHALQGSQQGGGGQTAETQLAQLNRLLGGAAAAGGGGQ
ncbi:MAG: hypothetical protein WKF84_28215 [Pyrinomonadaceae bacterium]